VRAAATSTAIPIASRVIMRKVENEATRSTENPPSNLKRWVSSRTARSTAMSPNTRINMHVSTV